MFIADIKEAVVSIRVMVVLVLLVPVEVVLKAVVEIATGIILYTTSIHPKAQLSVSPHMNCIPDQF